MKSVISNVVDVKLAHGSPKCYIGREMGDEPDYMMSLEKSPCSESIFGSRELRYCISPWNPPDLMPESRTSELTNTPGCATGSSGWRETQFPVVRATPGLARHGDRGGGIRNL